MITTEDAFKAIENTRQFDLTLAGMKFDVLSFKAEENMSQEFYAKVEFVSKARYYAKDYMRKEGTLTLIGRRKNRYFHGFVTDFQYNIKDDNRTFLYTVTLRPWFHRQTLIKNIRIFQNKTVIEIVKEVLASAALGSNFFEFRTFYKYQPREYCVQYNETNRDFITRICEEEGLFYYFEMFEDKHMLIFGDIPGCHKPIIGKDTLEFDPQSMVNFSHENVLKFKTTRKLVSGRYVITDFDTINWPGQLKAANTSETDSKLEIYEYPGLFHDNQEGIKKARANLQREMMFQERSTGKSVCRRFSAGHTFSLTGHTYHDEDKKYLITSVTHTGTQPQAMQKYAEVNTPNKYENTFTAIPADIPYRPERKTHKPSVQGVQTAMVSGPKGEEIYTDEYGRVKVRFHWDRDEKKGEDNTCWIRPGHNLAGNKFGVLFIPRIGQEVIVDFIEGDPDKPVITGVLYNGRNDPPYDLPYEKTKSTIKTETVPYNGGFNELRFEDKQGEEEIYIHGQKDWNIDILNDKGQKIGHDETLTVKNDRTKAVNNDQKETIGNNKDIVVTKHHTESIGENSTHTIGKNSDERVGENKTINIGKNRTETIGEDSTINIGKTSTWSVSEDSTVSVGKNITGTIGKELIADVSDKAGISIGKDLSVSVGAKTVVSSADEITFSCGSSSIVMKSDGKIQITGSDIKINASGKFVTKGEKISGN